MSIYFWLFVVATLLLVGASIGVFGVLAGKGAGGTSAKRKQALRWYILMAVIALATITFLLSMK